MPLEKARTALSAARRELDTLAGCDGDFVGSDRGRFLHHLPHALDRLAAVTRNIDSESKGHTTPEFSRWWDAKDRASQMAITALRNSTLKRYEKVTMHLVQIEITDGVMTPEHRVEKTFDGWAFETGDYTAERLLGL